MTPNPNVTQTKGQLYMVIETFLEGPSAVYTRFAERGRMLPDNLIYIDSWVDTVHGDSCYQLMRTDDPQLFDDWTSQWDDIVDFKVIPIKQSQTAKQEQG